MERTEVMAKIEKLLALGTSSNEAEASLAMGKAHELLAKYNLTMSAFDKKIGESILKEETVVSSGRLSNWKSSLLNEIAKANFCGMYRSHSRYNRTTSLVLVGKEVNVIATKVMMDYLFSTVERLALNKRGLGKSLIESYKTGLVEALSEKLRKLRWQDMANDSTRALVVVADKEVKDFMSGMRTIKMKTSLRNYDGYLKGRLDGSNISLNGQVGNNSGSALRLRA